MKRIVCLGVLLAVLCGLVGCTASPSATNPTQTTPTTSQPVAEQTTLKIMSFNIQTHRNGEVFWVRTEMMRDFIAEMQPDSIGMQEVTGAWRKQLDEMCFGEHYSGVGNSDETTGEMNAIYYRNDKFTLVDSGTFWLSDTPDEVASKLENSNENRTCTWARLKSKQTAQEFVHLNVHLDHNGENTSAEANAVRLEQGKVLMNFVQALGNTPLFLTGDFNQVQMNANGEYYPLYLHLTGQTSYIAPDGSSVSGPFADARMNAPDTVSTTEWASMVKQHRDGGNPSSRPIDYIFYTTSHFQPTVYRNILYVEEEIFTISDHLAQYAEFIVR